MAEDKKVKKSKKSDKGEASTTPHEEAAPPAEGEAKAEPEAPAAEAPAPPPVEDAAPAPAPAPVADDSQTEPSPPAASTNSSSSSELQRLEEKAKKAEDAHAAEVKVRKELEALNAKLLAEKTALLDSLSGEKGQLSDFQERCSKLQAQKNDLENQLRVSIYIPNKNSKSLLTQKKKLLHKKNLISKWCKKTGARPIAQITYKLFLALILIENDG